MSLTFDDGPDREQTVRLLELLRLRGVSATYFLLVNQAQAYPELVRQIRDAGHEIGLHGFDHTPLTRFGSKAATRVLSDAKQRLEEIVGKPVVYYRPPYGKQTPASLIAARRAGLTVVVWSADAADWEDLTVPQHVSRAFQRLTGGGILLLHERLEPGPDGVPVHSSVDPVVLTTSVLDELQRRALAPVSVSELVADGVVKTAWFRR